MINYIDYYFEATKTEFKPEKGFEIRVSTKADLGNGKKGSSGEIQIISSQSTYDKRKAQIKKIPFGAWTTGTAAGIWAQPKVGGDSYYIGEKLFAELVEDFKKNIDPELQILIKTYSKYINSNEMYTWINTSKLSANPVESPENDTLLFPKDSWKKISEHGSVNAVGYQKPWSTKTTFIKNIENKSFNNRGKITNITIPEISGDEHKIKCFYGNFRSLLDALKKGN